MTKVTLLANSKHGVRQGPRSHRANDPARAADMIQENK